MGFLKRVIILAAVACLTIAGSPVWAHAVKFAVFSDPHYYDRSLGTTGSAFEAYLAQDRKMLRESKAILNAAINSILSQNVDFVLVPGDLTKDGELLSHLTFASMLRRLEDRGIKVFVVPGNHDVNNPASVAYDGDLTVPVENVTPEQFRKIYLGFGYGEALYRDRNSLSYVAEPVPGVWLFGLDTCKYDDNAGKEHPETGGALKPETLGWVLEKIKEAHRKNKIPLAFFHHGVTEHFNGQTQQFADYVMDDWANVSMTLAEHGLKMVFTGHFHANDITRRTWQNGDDAFEIHDVATGSLVTWPCPYRIVTLHGANAATIGTEYITETSYDTDGVPFQDYAREYLRVGLTGITQAVLQAPPPEGYGLGEAEAAALAPVITEAFMAHYAGDEKPSAAVMAFIDQLLNSGDPVKVSLGMSLWSLWTDLPVSDSRANIALEPSIRLSVLGTYATGIFDGGAAEIAAFDPTTKRVFVVNGAEDAVDIIDAQNPAVPVKLKAIPIGTLGGSPNSVAVKNGIVAVAVEASPKQDPGKVVLFDTDGKLLKQLTVGALPDMLTFTPDGRKILVANEGEPSDDYSVDPEGSVSVIDLTGGIEGATVKTLDFRQFDTQAAALKAQGVRIFGPNASVAQDFEPEYIAASPDSLRAWVSLQENNALAEINLNLCEISRIIPLGFKNHAIPGKGIDVSDKDGSVNIQSYRGVFGMYQPDSLSAFKVGNRNYLIGANEGDSRDYAGFSEEERVKNLVLDPGAFPNAADLQADAILGRLNVTSTLGDSDGDGVYEKLYAFGARSFSIWGEMPNGMKRVFDSGQLLEEITAATFRGAFNSDNAENDSFDSRSDNKGPEPEGVAVGQVKGRTYAFIGLERIGGIMVFEVTDPRKPVFVQYLNNRNFDADTADAGDLGPEGLVFVPGHHSPTGAPLLIVANEISGTTTLYAIAAGEK